MHLEHKRQIIFFNFWLSKTFAFDWFSTLRSPFQVELTNNNDNDDDDDDDDDKQQQNPIRTH